jgi:serine protease Do
MLCGSALAILATAKTQASELRHTPIVTAVEQARPSIVNIHGEKVLGATDARPADATDSSRRVNGMGTGVVIDQRGYILTNHHVVDGVRKIAVTTHDKKTHVARLISHDLKTDLAVIKIDINETFPVISIGTSSDLMPAETVIAVGNAFGYEHTVTVGIISALHRSVQVSEAQNYDDLIQTDASINPGNSGGPLLNIDGEMIGINVAVRAGAQGIGFAIPVDKAMTIASELLSTKRVRSTWHGVKSTASPGKQGIVVGDLDDDSPAAASGLKQGDVITSIGDSRVVRALDVERALLSRQAGDEVSVSVERNQKKLTLNLVLASCSPTWDLLGLQLESIPAKQFQQYHSRYRGGLSVSDVRANSPAAKQGIRRGDILVGMHVWETVSLDNVTYILARPDFAELDPLKFYILRGNETLYGHFIVAQRAKQ